MSEHTPAPWAVNPAVAQVDAFDSGAPVPVCRLLWPTAARSEAETEANAHLLSAAPEMLDALHAAEDALTKPGISVALALGVIRAAINKAEGR